MSSIRTTKTITPIRIFSMVAVVVNLAIIFFLDRFTYHDLPFITDNFTSLPILCVVWLNFLIIPGFFLRRRLGLETDDVIDELGNGIAYSLAFYTIIFIIGFILETRVSILTTGISIIAIFLAMPDMINRGNPSRTLNLTWLSIASLMALFFLVGTVLIYFQGSLESDAYHYLGTVNRFTYLDRAVIRYPMDLEGGISPTYIMPISLLICSVISKTAVVHPVLLWLLSPAIVAGISLFSVFHFIRRLTENNTAAVTALWCIAIVTIARGLHFTSIDCWADWWTSILFPRNFDYYVLLFLCTSLAIGIPSNPVREKKYNFVCMVLLCLMATLNNLPAGFGVVGWLILTFLVSNVINGRRSFPIPWPFGLLILVLSCIPSLLISFYGLANMPQDTGGILGSGAQHHRVLMEQVIGTWTKQPYLWTSMGIILTSIYFFKKRKNMLTACICFTVIVAPFLIPQVRSLFNQLGPTPVVFTRLLWILPVMGVTLSLVALFFAGNAVKSVLRLNPYYIVVPAIALLMIWVNYPSNLHRYQYRLDPNSRYNQIIGAFKQRGAELQHALDKLDPKQRILVAGEPFVNMGQFKIKEIQMITGRDLTPWFGYHHVARTFLVRPGFESRNRAAFEAALLLENPLVKKETWWAKLETNLKDAKVGYILFFLENHYYGERNIALEHAKAVNKRLGQVVFIGKYNYIIALGPPDLSQQ